MEEKGVTFSDIQNMASIKNDLKKSNEKTDEITTDICNEEKDENIQDDKKNLDLIEAKGTIVLLESKLKN